MAKRPSFRSAVPSGPALLPDAEAGRAGIVPSPGPRRFPGSRPAGARGARASRKRFPVAGRVGVARGQTAVVRDARATREGERRAEDARRETHREVRRPSSPARSSAALLTPRCAPRDMFGERARVPSVRLGDARAARLRGARPFQTRSCTRRFFYCTSRTDAAANLTPCTSVRGENAELTAAGRGAPRAGCFCEGAARVGALADVHRPRRKAAPLCPDLLCAGAATRYDAVPTSPGPPRVANRRG